MNEIPMPGGWTLSAMWMPMCGQTWLGAATVFVFNWAVMMVPMMSPSLAPGLWTFWRQARRERNGHAASQLTALVALCYFLAWAMIGVLVFAAGATLAVALIRSTALSRAAPIASSMVIALAGVVQFTRWKARRIACCGRASMRISLHRIGANAACLHGARLARDCGYCCANLMLALLVFGVMDWRAMAAATIAMAAELFAPTPRLTANAVGLLLIATGLVYGHLT